MFALNIYRNWFLKEYKYFRSSLSCVLVADEWTIQKRARCTGSKIIKSPYSDVKVPYKSLTEFVWKDLNRWSGKVAIQCAETGEKYTYDEIRKLCARFAAALKKKFHKGQVLSIVLPNLPQYPVVLLGSIEAGLVVSTLNPNFTPAELSRQFEDSRTRVIVTLTSLVDRVKLAKKLIEAKTKREYAITIITLNESSQSSFIFNEMINEMDDGCDSNDDVNHDDVVLLPYSSGTSGFPKCVQLTHSNLLHNLIQLSHEPVRSVQEANADFQEVVPAVLPFFSIFGVSALILTSLINGCRIVSLKKFEPEKYADVIKREKATVMYLVPFLASFITSCSSIKANDLARVRVAFCAGSHTPVTVMEKLISLSGNTMKIRHAYGLTEASPAVCVSKDIDPLNSVGNPLPNTRIKIVDDNGNVRSSYQRGEICVHGPQVMKGYLNNEKATTEAIDADGFIHTGDMGYLNDEGKLFYVDRIKEIIKVKGFQVSPLELESVIKEFNDVKDCGVIGVPDERCGEVPVAFVVCESGKKIDEENLKRYVAENLSPYKKLKTVTFVDSIPKTALGKISKEKLRQMYAEST